MDQLSNSISEYLKICETIKKLNSKTIKAYRTDLSQFHTFMLSQEDFTEKTALNSFLALLHQKYKPKTVPNAIIEIFLRTMLSYSFPNRFHYLQNYHKRERIKRTYFANWE